MSDTVVIRRMRMGDLDAVAAIENATFARPWSRESFRQELERNVAARYLVAETDGKVVGYAGAWIILDESHITNIAVLNGYREKKCLTAAPTQRRRQCRVTDVLIFLSAREVSLCIFSRLIREQTRTKKLNL